MITEKIKYLFTGSLTDEYDFSLGIEKSSIINTTYDRSIKSMLYVEDFYSTEADDFNGNNLEGDGNDWWPAFQRALVFHIDTEKLLAKQRTTAPILYVGRDHKEYKISKTLHIFGIEMVGIENSIVLNFVSGTDGFVFHYPDSGNVSGTFHPQFYNVELALKPYEGFGSNISKLKNLYLKSPESEGNRGIIIHKTCQLENIQVSNFGWHGIHVDASISRMVGAGNANGCIFNNISAFYCGEMPGSSSTNVAPWRTSTRRGYGSGLRFNGGDSNVIINNSCDTTFNAFAGIHDTSFLGNTHILPHCHSNTNNIGGFIIDQEHKDIFNSASQWISDNPAGCSLYHSDREEWDRLVGLANEDIRSFRTLDYPVGERMGYAYVMDSLNSRGLLLSPYIESSTANGGLVWGTGQNMSIGGIGGRYINMLFFKDRKINGEISLKPHEGILNPPEGTSAPAPALIFGPAEKTGTVVRFDKGSTRPGYNKNYRLKYINYYDDDVSKGGPTDVGFWRLDHANINGRVAGLLTDEGSKLPGRTTTEPGRFWDKQRHYTGKHGYWMLYGTTHPDQDTFAGNIAGQNLIVGDIYCRQNLYEKENFDVFYKLVEIDGALQWRAIDRKKVVSLFPNLTFGQISLDVGYTYLPQGTYSLKALVELTEVDVSNLTVLDLTGNVIAYASSNSGMNYQEIDIPTFSVANSQYVKIIINRNGATGTGTILSLDIL
jgi:hypothetical protein